MVLLDLDDTIIQESDYFLSIFRRFAEQQKIPVNIVEGFMQDFESIRSSQKDIFTFFLTRLEINSRHNHLKLFELYKEIECSIQPLPGVWEFIKFCENKNITIVCLTNGVVPAQKNKWRNLKLSYKNYIKFEVAGDYNLQKPDINLYKILQIKYSIDWQKLIAIGDKYEYDLSVPFSLGSYAINIDKNLEINQLDIYNDRLIKVKNCIEAYDKFVQIHDII